jgi:hypothetical protein
LDEARGRVGLAVSSDLAKGQEAPGRHPWVKGFQGWLVGPLTRQSWSLALDYGPVVKPGARRARTLAANPDGTFQVRRRRVPPPDAGRFATGRQGSRRPASIGDGWRPKRGTGFRGVRHRHEADRHAPCALFPTSGDPAASPLRSRRLPGRLTPFGRLARGGLSSRRSSPASLPAHEASRFVHARQNDGWAPIGRPAGLPQAAGSPPRALPPTDAQFGGPSRWRKQVGPAENPDANVERCRR